MKPKRKHITYVPALYHCNKNSAFHKYTQTQQQSSSLSISFLNNNNDSGQNFINEKISSTTADRNKKVSNHHLDHNNKIDNYNKLIKNDDESYTLGEISYSSITDGELGRGDKEMVRKVEVLYDDHAGDRIKIKKLQIINQVHFKYVPLPLRKLNYLKLNSLEIDIKILPRIAEKDKHNNKVIRIKKQVSSYSIEQSHQEKRRVKLEDESESELEQGNKIESNGKSKRDQKQQKQKFKQTIKISTTNKSKKVKVQQKHLSSSQRQQVLFGEIDGFLRNCKCCGKLITKLCFKCPHIYCNTDNCPRKRKKILNERMLQKMKRQKIQQHYRQRQLYERMRRVTESQMNKSAPKNDKKKHPAKSIKKGAHQQSQYYSTSSNTYSIQQSVDIDRQKIRKSLNKRQLRKKRSDFYFDSDQGQS